MQPCTAALHSNLRDAGMDQKRRNQSNGIIAKSIKSAYYSKVNIFFHDGPTQKPIKQHPDKCNQPAVPPTQTRQPAVELDLTNWLGSEIEN